MLKWYQFASFLPLISHTQAAIKIPEESERQIAVHHVVQQLPPPHYRTLEYLLRHLSHVASFSSQTGMHAKNLAIVWSPNLLRPMALDSGGTALLEVNVQAIVIEYLIRNVHVFFDQHAAAAVIVANPRFSAGSRLTQQKVETYLGEVFIRDIAREMGMKP